MLMHARGHHGAEVELHAHHVVIRRKGITSALNGVRGEKSIPVSSITSVQFNAAGILIAGSIRFSVMGETKAFLKERDPNWVQFGISQAEAFERLRDAIQSAINLPSLPSIAAQQMQNRVRHSSVGADGRQDASRGRLFENDAAADPDGEFVAMGYKTIGDPPSDPTWDSTFDDIPPLEPRSPAEWWRELSGFSKIVTLAVLGVLILLVTTSGIDTSTPPEPTVQYEDAAGNAVSDANAAPARVAASSAEKNPAVPEATSPGNWIGKYDAYFDGATGEVEITPLTAGRLSVSIGMAGERCAGEIEAIVDRPVGDVITVSKAAYEDRDDQESACRISLRKQGDELSLSEDEVCMGHHGVSCGFDGTASRSK